MERLTQRKEDGTARCPLPEGYEPPCPVVTREALERLAAYEDTGLEPDKLQKLVDAIRKHEVVFLTKDQCLERMLIKVDGDWTGFTIAELQDFLRAKKEDRLIVLPCKMDDTLWVSGGRRVIKCAIDEVCFDKSGLVFMVSYNCEDDTTGTMNNDDQCDGCPFNTWRQDYSGEYSCDGEWGQASVKESDFGKTVFLTQEEAKAAIKKEENHGEVSSSL